MPLASKDAISVDVGNRLRQLRAAREISIRALAQKSGLSANALSMIERGKVSPSVSTLYRLAEALGVPVTDFFSPETERQKVVFLKAETRTRLPFPGGFWEGLGGEQFTGPVTPCMITLENGAGSGPARMIHTGHEFVFCLRGQLEYQVEDETFLLEAEDCLLFEAHLQHNWRNPGETITNALVIISDYVDGDHPGPKHMENPGNKPVSS
jgi:transcriptional regulator with XRE-family HTH domain